MNRYFYAFLLAFTFSAVPTIAQDNAAREIEEVVITALRKETNLQDTAITITAITAQDLEVKQIENFEDLQFAVPTLGFQKGAYSGSGITLRGIGNFAVHGSSYFCSAVASATVTGTARSIHWAASGSAADG